MLLLNLSLPLPPPLPMIIIAKSNTIRSSPTLSKVRGIDKHPLDSNQPPPNGQWTGKDQDDYGRGSRAGPIRIYAKVTLASTLG